MGVRGSTVLGDGLNWIEEGWDGSTDNILLHALCMWLTFGDEDLIFDGGLLEVIGRTEQ